MIPYIDVQLCVWGRWALRHKARAVGYPPVSPMFRDAQSSGVFDSKPPFGIDEYVAETDIAVQRLPDDLRLVAVEYYQIRGKSEDVARRLSMSKATLFRRIDKMHCDILGHLNVIAAGC